MAGPQVVGARLETVLREPALAVDPPDDRRGGRAQAGGQQGDHRRVRLPVPVGVDHAPFDHAGPRQLEADPLGGRRHRPFQRLGKPAELGRAQEVAPAVEPAQRERAVVGALRLAGGDRILGVANGVNGGAPDRLALVADHAPADHVFGRQPEGALGRARFLDAQVRDLRRERRAADAHEIRPRPGAQAQVKAAVFARHLLGDRRALQPDADLGAFDAASGLVGDAPLHVCLGPVGGVAPDDLAAELLLGRQQAGRHRPPGDGAFGRQPRAEFDAVPVVLRIAQRGGDRVRFDQRRHRAPSPRTRRILPAAPHSARRACPGWPSTRWARTSGCDRAGSRLTATASRIEGHRGAPVAGPQIRHPSRHAQNRVDRGSVLRK